MPRYPRGKLRPDDLGELPIRFVIQNGALLLIFPKPTDWIGLGPTDVDALIALLQQKRAEMGEA